MKNCEIRVLILYEVDEDGTVTVQEDKIIYNSGPEFNLPSYDEALPDHTRLDSIRVERVIGSRREPISWRTDRILGTERLRLCLGDEGRSPIKIYQGQNAIRSEFKRDHFYYSTEQVFSFYLHHRIPDHVYLNDLNISKTIKLRLAKPLDPKKFTFSMICLKEPSHCDRSCLTSSEEMIEMEFSFNLSQSQHYLNVISLLPSRKSRFAIPEWTRTIFREGRKLLES